MDIVAFDFRKFSHDGGVLYDGMRVDVEGPGLQSAMPFDVDSCDAVRACLAPDPTAS